MQEIRVLFSPGDENSDENSFDAQLTDAQGNPLGVTRPFTPPLGDDDYENLRWYLEEYMDLPDGGAVVRARQIERRLGEWGVLLYNALFELPENKKVLEQLLASPEPRKLTIATDKSALLKLPWELMADGAGSLAPHRYTQVLFIERSTDKKHLKTTLTGGLKWAMLHLK